jgi:hypothetical protein
MSSFNTKEKLTITDLSNLSTKSIIPNKSWIVKLSNQKIGTLYKTANGYTLLNNGNTINLDTNFDFSSLSGMVEFPTKEAKTESSDNAETTLKDAVYNKLYNVRYKLYTFTKTPESKCKFCVGYFLTWDNNQLMVEHCPKYIKIKKYPFYGPFNTQYEAEQFLSDLSKNDTN